MEFLQYKKWRPGSEIYHIITIGKQKLNMTELGKFGIGLPSRILAILEEAYEARTVSTNYKNMNVIHFPNEEKTKAAIDYLESRIVMKKLSDC